MREPLQVFWTIALAGAALGWRGTTMGVHPIYFWTVQDLDKGGDSWGAIFTEEHLAMDAAERIVGNRAVGGDAEIMLYGPGDGTTRVMVRRWDREDAEFMGLELPPLEW